MSTMTECAAALRECARRIDETSIPVHYDASEYWAYEAGLNAAMELAVSMANELDPQPVTDTPAKIQPTPHSTDDCTTSAFDGPAI